MTEASLKNLIESTLNIPVFQGEDSIIYPAATLEITGQSSGLIGDGRPEVWEAEVTINLWYLEKSARDDAVTILMGALLSESGTTVPYVATYYDTTAKKFRAVFNFNFILREE